MVRSLADTYETIDYIYVFENRVLVGVISLHKLLQVRPNYRIDDIMITPVVSVHTYSDQETAVHLALAQNIKAMPVIGDDSEFIGAIPADTILQVLRDKHTEDILKYAGLTTSR